MVWVYLPSWHLLTTEKCYPFKSGSPRCMCLLKAWWLCWQNTWWAFPSTADDFQILNRIHFLRLCLKSLSWPEIWFIPVQRNEICEFTLEMNFLKNQKHRHVHTEMSKPSTSLCYKNKCIFWSANNLSHSKDLINLTSFQQQVLLHFRSQFHNIWGSFVIAQVSDTLDVSRYKRWLCSKTVNLILWFSHASY